MRFGRRKKKPKRGGKLIPGKGGGRGFFIGKKGTAWEGGRPRSAEKKRIWGGERLRGKFFLEKTTGDAELFFFWEKTSSVKKGPGGKRLLERQQGKLLI